MTCYLRHLEQIFKRAGIEITRENRNEIDKAIHKVVRVKYKNCPAAWRRVKKRIAEDDAGFFAEVKRRLTEQA